MLGKLKLSGMDILVVIVLIGLGLLGHNWYMNHPTDAQMKEVMKQGKASEKGGGQASN